MADDEIDFDKEVVSCWCGETGPYEDLFDTSCLDSGCSGTGTLNCYCGGDFCVCHHHGQAECPGCEDCDFDDDQDDGDNPDDDWFSESLMPEEREDVEGNP